MTEQQFPCNFPCTEETTSGGRSLPQEDNWVHRSKGMQCKTCMWFVQKCQADSKAASPTVIGRCRKHCPTMAGYPAVFLNDWCGDHKLDENKAS